MTWLVRKSVLWLVPVVILPLGVLLVMQYRFLRNLEQATASAERNWLLSSVEAISRDAETYYRTASDRALTVSSTALASRAALAAHFAGARLGGAKTWFVYSFEQPHAMWFFDAGGRTKHVLPDEIQAAKVGTGSWQMVHRFRTPVPSPSLTVDERDPKNRVIVRPVLDEQSRVVGVAGVILDEKSGQAALQNIANATMATRKRENKVAIRFAEESRFVTRTTGGREYTTQPLAFVFTNWRVGIRDTCLSPEELAACNFRANAWWTGGTAMLLIGAIGMALNASCRQMRLSQLKSDFVSNVSHELRTPLSSIRVFGEYMRLGRVTNAEKVREYGEYIETESRRLTRLVNNILDFSRIESADRKYRMAPADVAALVAETAMAFETPLREQGVLIVIEEPPTALPLVAIDCDAIGQALVNLLDNAVKYSSGRKEVGISLAAADGEVRISVRDTGIGIPAREQKKIFEKFYRVGNSLVHDVKGSGLGLSLVNHIVRAHRGRVEVASRPGEGSTFTIVLPVIAADVTTDLGPQIAPLGGENA